MPTEANSINAATTGIVGNTGTAFTATAATQYNVLVGGSTTSTLTNVAPNATSGTPLCSAGSSSNPTFNTTPTVTSITISNAPSAGTDGTNKTYVDAIAAGLDFKNTCYAASTATLNASYNNGAAGIGAFLLNTGSLAAFTIDGTTPPITSRILVKDQSTTFQNGIYTLTTVGSGAVAWVLTRSTDYDQASEIAPGDLVPVQNGTVNADTTWLETATVTTIGTDPIVFQKFQSAPVSTTQYAVLVGGANNTVASVGPSATSLQILQSAGSSANPAFSTATYPATTTVSQLLYSSSTNVVAGLATANSAVLVTNSTGVPAMSGTMTNGQLIIGSTSATPTAATITAGTGISVTNGAASITIASTGSEAAWTNQSTSFSAAVGNGYFITGSATATLPASPSQGNKIQFLVMTGGSLIVTANTGQTISVGSTISTTAGTATNGAVGDSLILVYQAASTQWCALSSIGTWALSI